MDASMFRAWIHEAARLVVDNTDHLTRLDSAVGDADHGINMRRGLQAAVAMLDEANPSTPGAVLATVGRALISKTGGASGPLYGTGFRQAARTLGEDPDVSAAQLGAALTAALTGIQRIGAALEGDKTMIDALSPAVTAYQAVIDTGGDLANATQAASDAAVRGLKQTVGMQARKGRASYLGARTIGHEDPGAASTVLILSALATVSSAGERKSERKSERPGSGAAS
jgi:dihydroxyacetone kinase-like protein